MADSTLDVSPDEERFLRRAFRRFAWPYLVASLLALTLGGTALWVARSNPAPGLDPSESQALIAESASLRDALAALRQELDARGEQTGTLVQRIDALDRGFAEVTTSASNSPNLEARLEVAHQRINALESRLKSNAEEGTAGRLAKLEDRLKDLEKAPRDRILAPSPEPWPPASPSRP